MGEQRQTSKLLKNLNVEGMFVVCIIYFFIFSIQNNPTANEETITNKEVKNKESKGPGTIWQGATFGGDQDGKITAKFQRLMGIKNVSQGKLFLLTDILKI